MAFRGRGGRGGGRGGRGGFNNRGGRGGFDRNRGYDQGPPETVTLLGHYAWTAENDIVIKSDIEQVPFFNAPIYTESKQQLGKIDEIFGAIRDYHVSAKLSENIKASSFEKDTKIYIDPAKLLPLQRFLPKPPGEKRGGTMGGRVMKRDAGGRGRGNRGGRGSFNRGGGFGNRGGNGGFRGRGGGGNRNSGGSYGGGGGSGYGGGRGRW